MISIIGSGRVGATTAALFMVSELDSNINLVDIVEGLPQGEALDLNHTASSSLVIPGFLGRPAVMTTISLPLISS